MKQSLSLMLLVSLCMTSALAISNSQTVTVYGKPDAKTGFHTTTFYLTAQYESTKNIASLIKSLPAGLHCDIALYKSFDAKAVKSLLPKGSSFRRNIYSLPNRVQARMTKAPTQREVEAFMNKLSVTPERLRESVIAATQTEYSDIMMKRPTDKNYLTSGSLEETLAAIPDLPDGTQICVIYKNGGRTVLPRLKR